MGVKLLKQDWDITSRYNLSAEIIIKNVSCHISYAAPKWVSFKNKKENEPQLLKLSNFYVPGDHGKTIERTMLQSIFYAYKNNVYYFSGSDTYTKEEQILLIKAHYYKQNDKFTKLKKEIELFEKMEAFDLEQSREPIPEEIRFAVWRRDEGKCVKCGGRKNLEFDHIIPFSKGGSNSERNIQLLCQKCNREKSAKI